MTAVEMPEEATPATPRVAATERARAAAPQADAPRISRGPQAEIAHLRAEQARLNNDLAVISARIYDEAVERNWCREYDDWAVSTNDLLSQPWLPKAHFDRRVTFMVAIDYVARDEHAHGEAIVNGMYPEITPVLGNLGLGYDDVSITLTSDSVRD